MSATKSTTLLSLGLLASLAPVMTFAVSLQEVAADEGLSTSEAGWIGGIYYAGYAVAVPFLAPTVDRIDGRWVYIGSSLLAAISSFTFAVWANSFSSALILRFLGGAALAGAHMPGLTILMTRVNQSAQRRSAAIYTSTYAAGSATSFLFAGFIDAALGWRATFMAASIGPLLAIGALCLIPAVTQCRKIKPAKFLLRHLLRNHNLMAYVVAFAGNTWEVFAVRVWFVSYLAWILSLPNNALSLPSLGVVSGIAALAGVPASIAIAEAAVHFGQRLVIIATCLASVLVCLLLAVTTGGNIAVVLPLLVLLQITSFADVGALSSGAVTAADPARRGAALAIYALTGNLSGFLATAMVGTAIEWFGGARSATGWSAAFVTMALGSTVAAYAVHRVRD
jgi:predicted MFS family arabinose efflux permease